MKAKPQQRNLYIVRLTRPRTSVAEAYDLMVVADNVGDAAKLAVRTNPAGWYAKPEVDSVRLNGKAVVA